MGKTSKTNDEVLLEICTRSYWVSGQKVFFDIRVFEPKIRRYSKQTLKQCCSLNEMKRNATQTPE